MIKLTATGVTHLRNQLIAAQGGRCAVCQGMFGEKAPLDPCLDHDHRTGAVRGVLHRGCNALLGKVENNAPRYGVRNIAAFAAGVGPYLMKHMTNITGYLHNSFKNDDEKRLARNAKARKTRAAKKEPNNAC